LIGDISNSSTEQNAAVQQVSNSVTTMDQATQQSARMVEDIATSAANLRMQSDESWHLQLPNFSQAVIRVSCNLKQVKSTNRGAEVIDACAL
jgi:methyl-accepting chemotaxis protein